MITLIERAADLLFPVGEQRTRNVKFFCGGEDNVSAVELAEQIVRAEAQIRAGSARLVESIDR